MAAAVSGGSIAHPNQPADAVPAYLSDGGYLPNPTRGTLVVTEVFGPTFQGEGPSAGRRAGFVRLGGCNLSCSWCDTPYTWDASRYDLRQEMARQPVEDILDRALAGDPGLVVITGGEPLLHQRQPAFEALLSGLFSRAAVEIETNGTIAPTLRTEQYRPRYNVSPKLTHAGMDPSTTIRPDILRHFLRTGRAIFKFVCATPDDVAEAAEHVHRIGIPAHTVWISPEGVTAWDVMNRQAQLADPVLACGFNLSNRLHVVCWGNERAR